MNEKLLEVKNLRISFKTNSGTVKAVRGIDFSLKRGKTLAIVGESGSGKSVTSKAILGILANNSIIEDGEIIYDGKDLLTLSEEQFSEIRGVKISMIFQDPLSALNPIMHVGKQLTEAMYLEHKAVKAQSRRYIGKIERRLGKEDKELLNALTNIRKTSDDKLTIDAYKDLRAKILDAGKKDNAVYLENLKAAKVAIKNINDKYYEDFDKYNRAELLKDLNQAKVALKKCHHVFTLRSDNLIDIYANQIRRQAKAIEDSLKYEEHLKKVLEENQVETVFDLKANLRCKEREFVKSKESYLKSMKKLTNKLLLHLDDLALKYENVTDEIVDDLLSFYVEKIIAYKHKLTSEDTKKRAIELMREVGIPEPERRFNQYPFEFSGGMRQRIVIAIALSGNPEILICDEPTTALDVTIQAQILELINRLKAEKNLSIIFITHDLGVVANMADDISVMYAGKIVEYGTVYDIFYDPRHPYTWALLGSMPDLDTKGRLDAIPGTPPNMLLPPKGDAFAARNVYAFELDYKQEAPFFKVSDTHYAKTWLCHNDAPEVKAPRTVIERINKSLAKNSENKPTYELKKNSILEYPKETKNNERKDTKASRK